MKKYSKMTNVYPTRPQTPCTCLHFWVNSQCVSEIQGQDQEVNDGI